MTSNATIEGWLRELYNNDKYTHMLVVCDTFDYEDYPVYISKDEDVRERAKPYQAGANMTRLMEVYSKDYTLEEQMAESRVFNYDPPVKDETPTVAENGEAMQEIAEEGGPEAIGLVFKLMESSRRETDSIMEKLYEGEKASRERWERRALDAEDRIRAAQDRLMNLFAPRDPSEFDA